MTPDFVRTGGRLAVVIACLAATGCYVPGGGWTMRTGLDVRRYRKPSMFLELVDTRWDEYNRVAEMNLTGGMLDSRAVVTPNCPPGQGLAAPGLGQPIDPRMVPDGLRPAFPSNGPPAEIVPFPPEPGSAGSPRQREPNPLPGAPVDSLPTAAGNPPAAASEASDGSQAAPAADDPSTRAGGERDSFGQEQDIDAPPDPADRGDAVELSSFRRASRRRPTAGDQSGKPPPPKPALRPRLSRLFSPAR